MNSDKDLFVCLFCCLELVIWPKEVTWVTRFQPLGPLCLWQCLWTKLDVILRHLIPLAKHFVWYGNIILAYILSATVIDYSYGDPLCCIIQFYLNSGSFANSSGLFSWITNSTKLCAWKKFYSYKKKRSWMIYSCVQ